MNNSLRFVGKHRALLSMLVTILLAPMAGCAGEIERRWSEDVVLPDGSVVAIDRYVKFKESNAPGGDAYSSTDLRSTLALKGEQSAIATWEGPLVPLVLYRNQAAGEWVIVATTSNCDTWFERGSPVPPYWEFRLKSGKWEPSKLSELSLGLKTNLFFDYEPASPPKQISQATKLQIIQKNEFAKKYLSIDAAVKAKCMQR